MEIEEFKSLEDMGTLSEEPHRSETPQISRKQWCGTYAVPSADFHAEVVGAKSLNTIKLRVSFFLASLSRLSCKSRSPLSHLVVEAWMSAKPTENGVRIC